MCAYTHAQDTKCSIQILIAMGEEIEALFETMLASELGKEKKTNQKRNT